LKRRVCTERAERRAFRQTDVRRQEGQKSKAALKLTQLTKGPEGGGGKNGIRRMGWWVAHAAGKTLLRWTVHKPGDLSAGSLLLKSWLATAPAWSPRTGVHTVCITAQSGSRRQRACRPISGGRPLDLKRARTTPERLPAIVVLWKQWKQWKPSDEQSTALLKSNAKPPEQKSQLSICYRWHQVSCDADEYCGP